MRGVKAAFHGFRHLPTQTLPHKWGGRSVSFFVREVLEAVDAHVPPAPLVGRGDRGVGLIETDRVAIDRSENRSRKRARVIARQQLKRRVVLSSVAVAGH